MKQYAIYSDVDGTIYSHNQTYHPETKEAIRYAQKKHVEFIMCTGNPFFENMKNMSKELEVDYFIGSNGAIIFDVKNEEVIKLNTMTQKESQDILDVMNELEIGADWWDSNDLFANEFVEDKVIKILQNVISKDRTLEVKMTTGEGVHKVEGYTLDTPEGIAKIDELEKRLSNSGLQVARMKPFHLEVTKPGVSKGEAVKWLSNHLNIEMDNVMTIGDSANDHSMFDVTEFAYAMGNANDVTKKRAKLHTSTVEQNGLGEAIIDFMYRKRLTENFDGQK